MTTDNDVTKSSRPPVGISPVRRFRTGDWRASVNWPRLIATAAVVAIIGAAVGAAAAISASRSGVSYQSTAQLLIDDPRAISAGTDAGIIGKLSALRVKYVDLVPTVSFARVITTTAGVNPYTLGGVAAIAPADSLTLVVVATSSRRAAATRLATATAKSVVNYAALDQSKAGVPTTQRYTFTVVDPATTAAQIAPRFARVFSIGTIAGVIGAVLAGLAFWRRGRSAIA